MSDKLIRALVKPLSFVYGKAECEVGTYVIDSGQKAEGGRWWAWALNPPEDDPFYMWQHSEPAETEAAAQAAAEADYRARIAAALEVDKIAALVEAQDRLRDAVTAYHLSLDRREHGGIAGSRLVDAVQDILEMPWKQGAALAALGDREVG